MEITSLSLEIFLAYAKDACNWSGTPLIGGNVRQSSTRQDRGNVTQLKQAGLITTFESDGNYFIDFTQEGVALALRHGVKI